MKRTSLLFILLFTLSFSAVAQENPRATPTPSQPEIIRHSNETSTREKREQAYEKLFEGQRYIWNLKNSRSRSGLALATKLAKESFQRAVELDPTLAEGYTALAELTYKSPPNDYEEAIRLANIAVGIAPDNFGGHQILARLHTELSGIKSGKINTSHQQAAVKEWKEVVRLDPRNAEGFAFLSEFYRELNLSNERIAALKKWLSSAQPIDIGFYREIMGPGEDLSPEAALVKLGEALVEAGETTEAVEILSRAVADDPGNEIAIELLSRAIENADEETASRSVEALQQAIFANPTNISLIRLLAEVNANSGDLNSAAKLLRENASKFAERDKYAAASLHLKLGDLFALADQWDNSVLEYKAAFSRLQIENNQLITQSDRDFAETIFEKLVRVYSDSDRPVEVKKTIEQARLLFGNDDVFPDLELIGFYREKGQTADALREVRQTRMRFPTDYGLIKLEAEILTESGKVDEGVVLLRSLIEKKDGATISKSALPYDEFMVNLVISNLYSHAKRGAQAIAAANEALTLAEGNERKQIAKVTLATAYQMSGNFKAAEDTLREILKSAPSNPFALNNLGYFLLERNENVNEAFELIKKAVDVSPGNASFLDSLGWAYFKLNDLENSEKYLRNAIRIDSTSPTIFEHLGDVLEKRGNKPEARENWKKALKLSKDHDEIARLKQKLGEKSTK